MRTQQKRREEEHIRREENTSEENTTEERTHQKRREEKFPTMLVGSYLVENTSWKSAELIYKYSYVVVRLHLGGEFFILGEKGEGGISS